MSKRKNVAPQQNPGSPAAVGISRDISALYNLAFTDEQFAQVRKMIHERAGISLADSKKTMVHGRLSKRIRSLRMKSFDEYLLKLDDQYAREWEHFINALTTNITQFFREDHHFPILAEHMKMVHEKRGGPVKIWSAGCSSGEEPYSIAMAAVETFGTMTPPVQILATDIGTHVLSIAEQGVYSRDSLEGVSDERLKAFFLKGTGENEGKVRVMPELQRLIQFRRHNLRDMRWNLPHRFDAIFCRNVMIYFKGEGQMNVVRGFYENLNPDGLFFAGHSESLKHLNVPFTNLGKSVYRVKGEGPDRNNSLAKTADKR